MSRKVSVADILMLDQLQELSVFDCSEFKFHQTRKWRFDFVILETMIAIEIEGGAFTQGRHTRGVGFINDMNKYNHAALLGWRVLRFTPQQVLKGEAIEFIKRVLE